MKTNRKSYGGNYSNSLWTFFSLAVAFAIPSSSIAGIITVQNLDTANIIIPVFDTNLGTLDSVVIEFRLRAGNTSMGGSHNHSPYTILSSNFRSNSSVSGFGGTLTSTTAGSHTHSVNTGNYSAPGLNLGGFSFSTNPAGAHSHSVNYSFAGTQQVGHNAFRARVSFSPMSDSGHSSSYGSQTKFLSYTGSEMTPFLGPSDIVIAGGTLTTGSSGDHNHQIPGFSVTVGSNSGPWTWNFSTSTMPSVGPHSHTLNPRFDTITTFNYTAVPEPSSLVMIGLGVIAMLTVGCRRRQLATAR